MKKAVIFDLDGTLLNTLDSIAYCGNLALEHFGMGQIPTAVFPDFVGMGAKVLIEKIFKYVNGDPEIFHEFYEYYIDIYNKNGLHGVKPYSGIGELLDALSARGIKTAVLSNKPHLIVTDACREFFKGKFDLVYGQRENIPIKPDPYMVHEIAEQFSVRTNQCIYCGDSDVDIKTGKNSGALALGASWGFYGDSKFKDADGILKVPSDMLDYIDL